MSSGRPHPTPLMLLRKGEGGGSQRWPCRPPPAPHRWVLTRWVSTPPPPTRYFEEIFNASGNPELVKKYGDWFTYDKNPRAQIFRRNQTLVRDLDSMVRLMRWVLGTPPPPPAPNLGVPPCQGFSTLRRDFFFSIVINLYIFFSPQLSP